MCELRLLLWTHTFYEKWLVAQSIEQYESGKIEITFLSTSSVHNPAEVQRMKEINPLYEIAGSTGNGNAGKDATGWGDAAVWLPYTIFLCFDDKHIHNTEDSELDGEFIFDTCFHYVEWNEAIGIEEELKHAEEERKKPKEQMSSVEKMMEAKKAFEKVKAFIFLEKP